MPSIVPPPLTDQVNVGCVASGSPNWSSAEAVKVVVPCKPTVIGGLTSIAVSVCWTTTVTELVAVRPSWSVTVTAKV